MKIINMSKYKNSKPVSKFNIWRYKTFYYEKGKSVLQQFHNKHTYV